MLLEGYEDFCQAYQDDIAIFSQSLGPQVGEHQKHVRFVLDRLREFNLICKPAKTKLGFGHIEYLWFRVGSGYITPTE